jgi:hypothetical protein
MRLVLYGTLANDKYRSIPTGPPLLIPVDFIASGTQFAKIVFSD